MADVAARAGVSHQTVSRVINGFDGIRPETRDKVMAAIDELGYRRNQAARMLASTRSGLIGVVTWGTGLYGPAAVVMSLEDAALQQGHELAVVTLRDFDDASVAAAVDRLLSQAVEALVMIVPHRATVRRLERGALGVPVVTVLGDNRGVALTAALDNVGGARAAIRHLLELGHETVFHVAGPSDFHEATARIDGWRQELEAAGRTVPPLRWGGDWSASSGYQTGLSLAREPGVTAVFAANDQMALGVMRAFVEQGLTIPDDVSVVGFDDIPLAAYFDPPLTTVRLPAFELGQAAGHALLERIADPASSGRTLLKTELIVRASTATPPRT